MWPVDCLCTVPLAVFRLSAQANYNGIKKSRTLTIIESSFFSPPIVGSQRSWEAEDRFQADCLLFLGLLSRCFVKCSHSTVRSYCKYTSIVFSEEKHHLSRIILSKSFRLWIFSMNVTLTLSVLLNGSLKTYNEHFANDVQVSEQSDCRWSQCTYYTYILSEIHIAFVLYSPFLNRTLVNAMSCWSRSRYWSWLVSLQISCSFVSSLI